MAENSVVQPTRQPRWDGTTIGPGDVATFDGRRGPLFGLVLKNIVLTLLTFGFYRFWAKTRVRHWFWRSIVIAEERLEYTGTGKELFVGFLIAMCVLVPFFAVTSVLEQLAGTNVAAQVTQQVAYLVGLFLLIQAAIFRMRRYRLTRTMWRGVRCGLDGKTWDYMKVASGYWLGVLLTFGFAYPWMRVGLSRHLMTRTRFGVQRFGFEAEARQLLSYWAPVACAWLLFFGLLIALLAMTADFAVSAAEGRPRPEPPGPEAGAIVLVMVLTWVAMIPLYVRYRVREFRLFAAGSSLGEVRFGSGLRMGQIIWLYLGAALLVFVLIILLSVVIGGIMSQSLGSGRAGPEVAAAFLPVFFVVLIGLIVAMPIVNLVVIRFGLARAVVGSLKVRNLPAIEGIVQSTAATPGHGEGLADAFDLGDF